MGRRAETAVSEWKDRINSLSVAVIFNIDSPCNTAATEYLNLLPTYTNTSSVSQIQTDIQNNGDIMV